MQIRILLVPNLGRIRNHRTKNCVIILGVVQFFFVFYLKKQPGDGGGGKPIQHVSQLNGGTAMISMATLNDSS